MPTDNLISALRYLGVSVDIGKQEDRILVQKVAYVLQVLGFGIGFNFVHGSRGPYAFNLNKECNIYRWQYDNLDSSYKLTANEQKILNRVKRSGVPLTVQRLEGATSAIFLMREDSGRDDVEIRKKLGLWKETFSEEQLTLALVDAKRITFKDEYVTPAVKEELAAWHDLGMRSMPNMAE